MTSYIVYITLLLNRQWVSKANLRFGQLEKRSGV